MKSPKCLEGRRKRHYFGQNRGTASGLNISPQSKCVWCGWDRGYVYEGYWNKLWLKTIRAIKGDEKARATVLKETGRIIRRSRKVKEQK